MFRAKGVGEGPFTHVTADIVMKAFVEEEKENSSQGGGKGGPEKERRGRGYQSSCPPRFVDTATVQYRVRKR